MLFCGSEGFLNVKNTAAAPVKKNSHSADLMVFSEMDSDSDMSASLQTGIAFSQRNFYGHLPVVAD